MSPNYQANAGSVLPSVTLALLVAVIDHRYGAPAILMGLMLGLSCHFLNESDRFTCRLVWASGPCLKFGVALPGLRLSVSDVATLVWSSILVVGAAVMMTLLFGVMCSRLLGCERHLGLLTGSAVGICGASAAMAISAALLELEAKQRQTLFTVIGVTTLSTAAMVFYPIVGDLFTFSSTVMGLFIGATIHDVAQVVGAGCSISSEAGDLATFVKLVHVAMPVPIVMAIALCCRRDDRQGGDGSSIRPACPGFLVGFVSLFVLDNVAVTALGVRTSLHEVTSIGWRPTRLLAGETVLLAAIILGFLLLSGA